jgi:hypothetical protein
VNPCVQEKTACGKKIGKTVPSIFQKTYLFFDVRIYSAKGGAVGPRGLVLRQQRLRLHHRVNPVAIL